MASRQEWAVSSQCTGMMNHACGGSHSKTTSLFTGANEASAVMNSESESCCDWGGSKKPEQENTKGIWRLPFPSSATRMDSTKTTPSGCVDPSPKLSYRSPSTSVGNVLLLLMDLLARAQGFSSSFLLYVLYRAKMKNSCSCITLYSTPSPSCRIYSVLP